MYDRGTNKYVIANIRQMPLPTNEPEHFEDWRPFLGYSDIDGCVVLIDANSKSIIVVIQGWPNGAEPKYLLQISG